MVCVVTGVASDCPVVCEIIRICFWLQRVLLTSGELLNMLPQTSSSQLFEPSMTVSGFILALLRPTSVSKSTPESKFGGATPLAGIDRSSMRCESRKNWLCSFSTRSPSLRMTPINRWNCWTFNTMNEHQHQLGLRHPRSTHKVQWTSTRAVEGQELLLLLYQS